MARISAATAGGENVLAFLDMLAHSEIGPKLLAASDDGYNVLVGGSLFSGYADHPRKVIEVRPGLRSSAAGRYQLLARYFDPYKQLLELPDFSPESQDCIAVQQIRECRALDMVRRGEFEQAVARVAHIWASLPGAGYRQHENKLADLEEAYLNAGGQFA